MSDADQELVLRIKKRMEEVHNADDRFEMPGWYHELAEAAVDEMRVFKRVKIDRLASRLEEKGVTVNPDVSVIVGPA